MAVTKSGSLRHITILAIINCALIVLFAIFASAMFKKTGTDGRQVIENCILDSSYAKGKNIFLMLSQTEYKTTDEFAASLQSTLSTDESVLSAVIFLRTSDENFFRVSRIMRFNAGRDITIKQGTEVRSGNDENYIRRALYETIADEKIYQSASSAWYNIYGPAKISNFSAAVQISYSADPAGSYYAAFTQSFEKNRRYITIGILIYAALSFIVTVYLLNHTIIFVKELTGVVKNAAKGGVTIDPEADSDISELALSFNSLVGEIKEKEKIISEMSSKDSFGDLFKLGVSLLKENNQEDALAIFKTLIMIKGDSFGSCFNSGIIYAKKKQYAEALAMLNKALLLNPGHELTKTYIEKLEKSVR